jgi:hypothetical protein
MSWLWIVQLKLGFSDLLSSNYKALGEREERGRRKKIRNKVEKFKRSQSF